jgi:nucleotide-binding universal stress UspA family protein
VFQKILLGVDDRPESKVAATRALEMAKLCDARIFAAWVLNPEAPTAAGGPGSSVTAPRRGPRRPKTASEPEELAWSRLYEIEDSAFEANVRISLLLETGNRDEKLLALIDSYQLEALVIGARSVKGWESLIERCPVIVILAR